MMESVACEKVVGRLNWKNHMVKEQRISFSRCISGGRQPNLDKNLMVWFTCNCCHAVMHHIIVLK